MNYTPCLNLFKYDMTDEYDLNAQFLIEQALNENWDKLDLSIKNILEKINTKSYNIGDIIIRLDNSIYEGEIELVGSEVLINDYKKLYDVYGNAFGTPSDNNHFILPNFKNRTIWGWTQFLSNEERYIEAGLPDHTHTLSRRKGDAKPSGSEEGWFSSESSSATRLPKASANNSIYGNSDTVQPPAVKVRFLTRYK